MEIEIDATVLPTSVSVTVTLDNAGAARHPCVPRQVCDLHHWSRLCTAGGEGTTAGPLQAYQQPWQGVS